MRITRRNEVLFNQKLNLEIYLIGYRGIGESILFIIKTDTMISYSGVIDCYEHEDINKTVEFLDKFNINKIDFLCWTHPDMDHSLGIDSILLKFVDANTKIVLPEHILGEEYAYNPRIKETFKIINNEIKPQKRNKKYKVKSASDIKRLELKKYKNFTGEYLFDLYSIAPDSTLVRSRALTTSKTKKNIYSIALVLSLGEINILFSGDIENQTINNIDETYLPEKFDYIKTPHHTSQSSENLLKYLDCENRCEIACTTSYSKFNLPDKKVIKKYRDYAYEFYCTDSVQDENERISEYGIILVNYDIINKRSITKIYGRAEKVFSFNNKNNCIY